MLSTPNAMPPGRMPPVAPNPWRDVQSFVGKTMAVAMAPIDMLNQAAASATFPLAMMLPAFPAVRLFVDLALTIHVHPHPPTFGIPIPAVGPCVAAGACTVLINGLPAARSGDFGLSAWCGGYFPVFEVVTGSSHCMIQGARPARVTDITLHCTKTGGLGAIGVGMMLFSAAMGAVGVMAAETDAANALAADAAAEAAAAAVEVSAQSLQLAADCAAMALSVMMGMDPAVPPAIGMFITGSPNVLIGGFPMPGWMVILKGLLKILRLIARAIQLMLPEGSRLRNSLCTLTGHPVDVATGRMFTSQVDFEFPWRVPIRFARHYDSASTGYEGTLGSGWNHSYEIHLWHDAAQQMVILRDEEGHLEGFSEIALGGQSVHPLHGSTLQRPDERAYRLTRPDGLTYTFSEVSNRTAGKDEKNALRLTGIENRNGCRVSLRYDGLRLAELDDHTGRRIAFRYITLRSGSVRLSELRLVLEPPLGSSILASFAYDDEGRLTSAFDANLNPYRYAYAGNLLIRETNRNGMSFHFEYDDTDHNARCVHTWGDGGIYERRLSYDAEDQRTTVVDSRGGTWTYYWNEAGLVTNSSDPLGNTKTFTYDGLYRKIMETLPDGSVSRWVYGDRGNVTSFTNPLGQTTTFAYDAAGRPVHTELADNSVVRRGFDERGNIIWTENGLGAKRKYAYDESGDLIEFVTATGGTNRFEYNSRGELVSWSEPDGSSTTFSYTAQGMLATVTGPGGRRTEYGYDTKGRLIHVRFSDGTRKRYRYDAENNLTGFTNTSDYLTEYHYGGLNRVVERVEPTGHRLRYFYDTEENLIALVNQRGERYLFNYDRADRCVEEETFDGVTRRYGYDRNGWTNRIEEASAAGGKSDVTMLEHDTLGQLLTKHLPSGAVHQFAYDPMGRLIKAETQDYRVTLRYDAGGNLIQERQGEYAVQFEYDEDGRRKRRTSSWGHTLLYEFASTHLAAVTMMSEKTESGLVRYRYDRAGNLMEKTTGGARETFEYDLAGRLTRQELVARERSVSRAYRYSPAGAVATILDSRWGRDEFAHDPAERLTMISRPAEAQERFEFDPAGNFLVAGDKRYDLRKGNRIAARNGSTYRYNDFGDLVERPAPGGSGMRQMLEYTDQHRLACVTDSLGQPLAKFEYDALGRRIKKASSERNCVYLWDGNVLLAEIEHQQTREYVFEGFSPVLQFSEDGVFYYHNDQVGTPRALTNAEGQVVWEGLFHPWGKLQADSGTAHQPIGRPGQYIDTETGLAYNFFRYYDPDDGRYITHDPIQLEGGTNVYHYPEDPLAWVDPLGLNKCGAEGRQRLREMGLEGVELAGSSFNRGKKQLEAAGFTLVRTTRTGRRVFENPETGAVVNFDSGGALVGNQKPHWHIVDAGGQHYDRSGRPVGTDEGAGHIPAG
jgi:RHS repeat-associated protein